MPDGDIPQLRVADRAALRAWLVEHGAVTRGVWPIMREGPERTITYDQMVEELLCFGWIDGQGRSFEDRESMQYVAPRKPASAWSRPNKERIARLSEAGLMAAAGIAVVEAAKASGRWTALDEVEQGVEPPTSAQHSMRMLAPGPRGTGSHDRPAERSSNGSRPRRRARPGNGGSPRQSPRRRRGDARTSGGHRPASADAERGLLRTRFTSQRSKEYRDTHRTSRR